MSDVYLVTGAAGFIGRKVVALLRERKAGIVAFDRTFAQSACEDPEVTQVEGDLSDFEMLERIFREHGVNRVIHLAAWLTPACQADPVQGAEVNLMSTLRLLDLAHRFGVRGFAFASSFAVHGRSQQDAPGSLAEPQTFYGVYKRAAEMIAAQYWASFRLPSIAIRPVVVYGPGRETGLTAGLTLAAKALIAEENFEFCFSGESKFEFVDDTAKAFVRAATEGSEDFQIVDLPGHLASVEEVIAILRELRPHSRSRFTIAGEPLPYTIGADEYSLERLFPDWRSTSLREGLAETVAFYERQRVIHGSSRNVETADR